MIAILLAIALGSPGPSVQLVAGGGTGGDGPALEAKLVNPFAVGFDRAGNLYLVEMEGGERLRKLDKRGTLTTVAGSGVAGSAGDGGKANEAQLNGSHHILVQPNGDIFIADTFNNRVRKVDGKTGRITAFAGTGEKGFSGDGGPARYAEFGGIYCLAFSPGQEKLYLCDLDNRRIRAINMETGIVTTVAGNGKRGSPDDGAVATESPLYDPRAIAVDSRGNLYILERGGNALRVVDSNGRIRTVIGGSNKIPDPPVSLMNGPKHLCIDRNDNVLIADTENHRILRYEPQSGKTTIIAGTGTTPGKDEKPNTDLNGGPLKLHLNQPHGVFARPNGDIYIADSSNGRILRITESP